MRSTRQVGPSGPEARSLEQFTATDDRGTRYQMMVRDLGGGTDGWTLIMRPLPPQDATVTTGPGQASPGDHVLHAVAARLLARAGPDGFPLPESTPRSGPLAPGTDGFGDVIAAVQAADALSPSSPVPGQFAALCARLHLPGHGITAPPAHGLPGSWAGMLAHHRRGQAGTAPAADGGAALALALPELDQITLAILGLHNCQGRTVMHMHASGPMSR